MLTVPAMLAGSSLADSPEAGMEELEGLVTMPGNVKDVQIADIPVVTAMSSPEGPDMYVKPISPSGLPHYRYHSTCSSPETALSLEASCPATERDHMYATHSPSSTLVTENKHLKGMLMAHLDIIQQQSETIVSKDKMLKALREETGLLRQKLSRMTRRLRPEGGPEGGRRAAPRRSLQTDLQGKRPADLGPASPERPAKRRVKEEPEEESTPGRTGVLPVTDTVDELRDEFCQQTSPEVPVRVSRRSLEPSEEEEKDGEPAGEPAGPTGTPCRPGRRREEGAPGDGRDGRRGRGSLGEAAAVPPSPAAGPPPPGCGLLTTAHPYYVGCREVYQKAISAEDQLTEVPSLQRGVEVPCWREEENHYALFVPTNKISFKKSKDKESNPQTPTWRIKSTNPLYTSESTESVDDASFLRRHDKLEKDEKQRKRWDQQRMRQEAQLQKLRARQERNAVVAGRCSVVRAKPSLLPALEAATHICVESSLPVAAFGRPLPDLAQHPFTLPWLL